MSFPQGDWLCTTCTDQLDSTGVVPTATRDEHTPRTARELFLSGKEELMLARVERIFREGAKGQYQITVRWCVPENPYVSGYHQKLSKSTGSSTHSRTHSRTRHPLRCRYMLPEETHTGRRPHHSRREVFLSSLTNDNDADCIYREFRWVTLRARWVTRRARWVTLRARWVTLRALWVTLRARWVTAESSLGDAKSSLGDAKSSLGDAESSLE